MAVDFCQCMVEHNFSFLKYFQSIIIINIIIIITTSSHYYYHYYYYYYYYYYYCYFYYYCLAISQWLPPEYPLSSGSDTPP